MDQAAFDAANAAEEEARKIGREIGKDAAEKSKGLLVAEDWSCTKCGNINWIRRNLCNVCNAPKLGDLVVNECQMAEQASNFDKT